MIRRVVTAVLLVFVAASVAAPIVRSLRAPPAEAVNGPLPADRLVVYYFHTNVRCRECRSIEACTRAALEKHFAEELRSGRLEWRVVNYQRPGNEHFAVEFQLIAATVVLAEVRDGKVAAWKNLDRVWDFIDDREAMTRYVTEEVEKRGQNYFPAKGVLTPFSREAP